MLLFGKQYVAKNVSHIDNQNAELTKGQTFCLILKSMKMADLENFITFSFYFDVVVMLSKYRIFQKFRNFKFSNQGSL